MSEGFDVDHSALHAYARAVDAAAERIGRIHALTQQLGLTEKAFGRLPQSDDMKSDYDTQREASNEDFQDAVETLTATAEALRSTATAYDSTKTENTHIVGGSY